ncbi:transcription factor A2-like protein [Cannes 8 virus]|uniref:conserved putative transcription factor A2-like protein n=1 Tax=Melbournevirus TaxID=1560514 RepID=UPI000392BE66|nr:conserved putative transcription factor A2-like protein [Melbournevirus]AGV01706.1 transcription factor A2-like protein [Cannes 8 virus]AIT54916.1 poxvirus late transcription factor VLTF3-like protein [Melbournevirus]
MNQLDIPGLDEKIKEEFVQRLEAVSKKEKELDRVEFIYFNSPNREDVSRAKERAYTLRKEISGDNTLAQMEEYSALSAPLLKRYQENLGKVRKVSFFGSRSKVQGSDVELLNEFLVLARNYIEVDDRALRVSRCRSCDAELSQSFEKNEKLICGVCGEIFHVVEEASPYKDSQRNSGSSKPGYVTKLQFLEVIEKFQAKKNTRIPLEVKEKIVSELKKYGIPLESVTKKHIYMVLVDNNLTDYYEELSLLLWELNGTLPPDISAYQEELSNCYDVYEKVYLQIKEKERRKSLNAWYVLYKLLQHLKYTPNPDDFCFLKNTMKTRDCDEKFLEVCKRLGWNDFRYTL